MLRKILSIPYIWLVIIPLIGFLPLSSLQYCMKWDTMDATFPWHYFFSNCFHEGIFPFWSPYARLGMPIYADLSNNLFYPITTFICAFTNYSVAIANIEFAIHLPIAAIGMFLLLKQLGYSKNGAVTFGIVYALSGIFVSNAMHFTMVVSAAWTPWVLWSQKKWLEETNIKNTLIASLCIGMLLTGGYTAIAIIWIYILLGYYLFFFTKSKEKIRFTFSLVVLALVCVTFFITPYVFFIQHMPLIDRGEGVSLVAANLYPFSFRSFISFLFPLLTTSSQIDFGTDISMRNGYFGLLMLPYIGLFLLTQKPRKEWIVFGIGIGGLVISVGGALPFREWLYEYIPLMDSFRFPAVFRFVSLVCFVIVACASFDWLLENRKTKSVRIAGGLFAGFLMVSCITAFSKLNTFTAPIFSSWEAFYGSEKWNLLFIQSGFGLLFFVGFIWVLNSKKTNPLFLATLVLLDLLSASLFNQFSTVVCAKKATDLEHAIHRFPKEFIPPSTMPLGSFSQWGDSSIAPPIWQNAGYLKKEITPDGYGSFILKNYNQIFENKTTIENCLQHPFAYLKNNVGGISVNEFFPNRFSFIVMTSSTDTLCVQQMNHPYWSIFSNQGELKIIDDNGLLSVEVPKGKTKLTFVFSSLWTKLLVLFHFAIWIIAIGWIVVSLLTQFWQRSFLSRHP